MLLELSMTLTTLLGKYFFLRDSSNNPEGVIRDSRVSLIFSHASYNLNTIVLCLFLLGIIKVLYCLKFYGTMGGVEGNGLFLFASLKNSCFAFESN